MIKKILIIFLFTILNINANQTITIAGPSAGVTHPVFHMMKTNALKDVGVTIKFKQWKGPDELKALILNKKVDFIAVPITAGSILYNRGASVQLTHLVMGGTRGIVSSHKNVKTFNDLKGLTVGITSRGGMSDSLLKILLKNNGLDYKKDINLVYTQNSKNATLMLLKGKIDATILAEPRISMALKKAKSLPSDKQPHKLFLSINLNDEWKRTFKTDKPFAQVGFLAVGDTIKNKPLIKEFIKEYKKSLDWYKSNEDEASQLTAKYFKGLHPKAIKNGIRNSSLNIIETSKDKKLIKKLLKTLVELNPKSMGSKVPQDGFYFTK